jgi:hypothetical protein
MKYGHTHIIFFVLVLVHTHLTINTVEKENKKLTRSSPLVIAVQQALENKPESPRAFSNEDKRTIYQSIIKRSPLTKKKLLADTYHALSIWITNDYFRRHHDETSQKRSDFLETLFPQLFIKSTCTLIHNNSEAQKKLRIATSRDPHCVQKFLYTYALFNTLVADPSFLATLMIDITSFGFIHRQTYYNKHTNGYSEKHFIPQTDDARVAYFKSALRPTITKKASEKIRKRIELLLLCHYRLKKNNLSNITLDTIPKVVVRHMISTQIAHETIKETLQPIKNNFDQSIDYYDKNENHSAATEKLRQFLNKDFSSWYDANIMRLAKRYTK